MNDKILKFKEEIKGKKVSVIGMGVSNIPAIKYLQKLGAYVIGRDKNEEVPAELKGLENVEFVLGKDYLKGLKESDYIFRSPGVKPSTPEIVKAVESGVILTSEMETFIHLTDATVIAITGSDGKTTTTTLTSLFLKEAGKTVYVGGNIGTPLLDKVEQINKEDYVVLELSSFQLMTMKEKIDRAAITNVAPNHLDYHKDYEEYIQAKSHVFKGQDENGILVLNEDNEFTQRYEKEAKGKIRKFSIEKRVEPGVYYSDGKVISNIGGKDEEIMDAKDIKIVGMHNVANVCTASSLVIDICGKEAIKKVAMTFGGVEHRMELVREIDGVKWYNDSASSSPTRTISGLNAFKENIILIAGGYDKNLEYEPLAKPIVNKVSTLILIGQTAEKIYDVVKNESEKENKKININMCDTLEQTIEIAKKSAKKGDIVLFSPASASFDMFKNFADRGNQFKDLVNKI